MRRPTPTGRSPQRRVLLESITAFVMHLLKEQSGDPCPVNASLLRTIFFSSSHPPGLRFHYISLILSFHLSFTSAPFFPNRCSPVPWGREKKKKIKSVKSSFWTSKQFNLNLLSCHFHGWLLWGQQRKVFVCFVYLRFSYLDFDGVFVSSPEWVHVQSIWTTVKRWLLTLDCFFCL